MARDIARQVDITYGKSPVRAPSYTYPDLQIGHRRYRIVGVVVVTMDQRIGTPVDLGFYRGQARLVARSPKADEAGYDLVTIETTVVRALDGRLVEAWRMLDGWEPLGCRKKGVRQSNRFHSELAAKSAEGPTDAEIIERSIAEAEARELEERLREIEEREARPKDTSEVREQSDAPSDESPYHGGDGASGECEPQKMSASEGPSPEGQAEGSASGACPSGHVGARAQTGRGDQGSSAPTTAEGGSALAAKSASPAGEAGSGSARGDAPAPGAPADPTSTSNRSDRPHVQGHPGEDGSSLARGGARDASGEGSAEATVSQGAGAASEQNAPAEGVRSQDRLGAQSAEIRSSRGDGGNHLGTPAEPSPADRRAGREIARLLSRIVGAVAPLGDEPSPRLDGQKLAEELVSRRLQLSRCRKIEIARWTMVLAIDVSGSCSASCRASYAAAVSVAEAHPDNVVLVIHSNGHVYSTSASKSPRLAGVRPGTRLSDVVERLGAECRLVINWGDLDAIMEAREVSQRSPACRMIWLDSYLKSAGVRPASPTYKGHVERCGVDMTRISCWQGIGDAASTEIALRRALSTFLLPSRW